MALLRTSYRIFFPLFAPLIVFILFSATVILGTRAVVAPCLPRSLSTPPTDNHPIPPSPLPRCLSTGSALPLPISYGSSDHVQLHQRVGLTISESKRIHLHPHLFLHNNNDNNKCAQGYLHSHSHRRTLSDLDQDFTMASPSEQQQQQTHQQWNQPSGTAFAEGLPLWTAGTINSRSLRNPFVKSFGLRHKATMDWGMRARARTQRHWDKYWHQLETGDESSDLFIAGTTSTDTGTDKDMDTRASTGTYISTDANAEGSGGENGAPGQETTVPSSPDTISDSLRASLCTSASNCTQNLNLSINYNNTDGPYSATIITTTTTAIKDSGLARAETEPPTLLNMITPPLGDNDGPGSLFFSQLLNHYQKPPPPQESYAFFTSTTSDNDNNSTLHTNTTFRQYYQINREFYKPGGPIILWLPGESPLHSLFLRRGLAYELANATAGLLVALEHRFYGNSIPRFQDSLVAHKDGSLIFDASQEKQEPSSASSHPDPLSDPEYAPRYVITPPSTMEGEEEEEVGRAGDIWKVAGSQASTSPNSGPSKFNNQISIDEASRARIKGHRHKNLGGDRQQDPHPPHQTDKANGNRTSNGNSDPTDDEEKEGLPLDLLKYLNVDQSIEDIAYFIDLFPTLQPKLFPPGECDRVTTTSNLRWILAGCSYGGNLAAWTRQRYTTKVFAAFASSAPVRSALDFFEYSTSQTDILGDKCSTQLGLARDFLDGALQMTDGFMQQMDAFDLEIKQQGAPSPAESTAMPLTMQEHAQLAAETSTFDDSSASTATTTAPISGVGDDDKARRQAAKLRVLSWFSPDFAREYAAEGEEIHAAGWIWWTVASAVQYNAVVSPITVQPAKTAVDILCDAMNLAKVDELAGGSSSTSNNSLRSQLKSLRYTETLASWFKDQQYFTPTKQEDLQPSDLDPTSVQNLAGMAWLWQTCSELGYLQTAHPSTCCCPSFARASPFQSSDATMDFISNSTTTTKEQGSNRTCPLNSEAESTFYSPSFPTASSYLHPPAVVPSESAPITTTAGSTCLPCRCYADEAQRSESVFSRLLTLEAAWQECQFYFSSTHPPARNSITRPSSFSFSSPPSSSEDTAIAKKPVVKPAGAVEVDTSASIIHQEGQSSGGAAGDAQQHFATNPGPGTTQQQQEKREDILLMGYPDVETNVNTKFRGWEIAQDPCYPSGSVNHESATEAGGDNNDSSNNNNSGYDETHSASSPTSIKATAASGTTTTSLRGPAVIAAPTASESEPSQEGIVEQKTAEDSPVVVQSRFPRITSELDDWLIDHPGGRYYFTNGEKDPWKELTLASSRALEFLSRPRVGGGSSSMGDSEDVGASDKEQSTRRVTSRQHFTVPAVSLESTESLQSELPASIETRQGGGESTVALAPQDAIDDEQDDEQDDDPMVVSKESSFSPASPIDVTTTSTQHRDSHNHQGKHHHHHHHHHRRRHRQRKHHRHHRKRLPKNPTCTQSIFDPCQFFPSPTRNSRGRGYSGTASPQPKLSVQDEGVTGDNGSFGSNGTTGVVDEVEVEVDEIEKEDEGSGTLEGNNQISEDEYGDRTVMRIISDASHCQDILYESSDLDSVKLRTEREHVLKTFVRWIEIDDRRQQRALERRQK